MTSLLTQVEQFLYREARLADAHEIESWLELWVPDEGSTYWVAGPGHGGPDVSVAIVYDAFPRLKERLTRLTMPGAHAQEPRSSLCRVVSNVEVVAEEADEVSVASVFALHDVRRSERLHVGRCEHRLRRSADGFAIRSKNVFLNNRDAMLPTLAFIL